MRFWMALLGAFVLTNCGGIDVMPREGRGVLFVHSNLPHSGYVIAIDDGSGTPKEESAFKPMVCNRTACPTVRTHELKPGDYQVCAIQEPGYTKPGCQWVTIEEGQYYEILFEYVPDD